MSRTAAADKYVLRLNLKSASDVRRFCEVHVKEGEVYVLQPKKDGSVKISYHESGERHLKNGNGPAMYTLQLDKPEWIKSEEPCWEEGFQNFANLLPYRAGEATDATFDIDLPSRSTDTTTFAQVSIGRYFDRPDPVIVQYGIAPSDEVWQFGNLDKTILDQYGIGTTLLKRRRAQLR